MTCQERRRQAAGPGGCGGGANCKGSPCRLLAGPLLGTVLKTSPALARLGAGLGPAAACASVGVPLSCGWRAGPGRIAVAQSPW